MRFVQEAEAGHATSLEVATCWRTPPQDTLAMLAYNAYSGKSHFLTQAHAILSGEYAIYLDRADSIELR